MKKLLVVLVGIFLFAVATTAFAEVKATVGVKAWANKWDFKQETLGGSSKTWDNGNSIMVGPSLNLRFADHFFVGATYLKSMKDYESSDWFSSTDKMAFERTDLDLTAGVMFSRYFGFFAGYKTIDAPATYSDIGVPAMDLGTWKLKGPGFGLVASIPLGGSAALYGNLAFMKMKSSWDDPSGGSLDSTDYTGGSIELGGAVAFTPSFSGTLGYKIQSFEGDVSGGGTDTHTFSGVTLGLNYTF
jgi:hypothetical protein